MRTCVVLLALCFYGLQTFGHTTIEATHDATIVQRGNFVIAAVLAPPLICYGTRMPKSVSCKESIQSPGEKEIKLGVVF
jgi:hypothetical protein